MANLNIIEWPGPGYVGLGLVPVADARGPKLAAQNIAIGGTSVPSAAFNAKTNLIRIETDAICAVEIAGFIANGINPVAIAPNGRMVVGQSEYYTVTPGDKLAVITST